MKMNGGNYFLKKNNFRKALKLFKQQLIEKAKKMSNKELRRALWKARKTVSADKQFESLTAKQDNQQLTSEALEKELIREEIFSEELQRRGLLRWALKTGKEKINAKDDPERQTKRAIDST